MRHLKNLVLILAILLGLTIEFTSSRVLGETNSPSDSSTPVQADNFRLTGVAGADRSLSDFRGKTVVLEFVDFSCPTVQSEYKDKTVSSLQERLQSKGVVWLSVCSCKPGEAGFFSGKNLRLKLAQVGSRASDYLIDSTAEVAGKYRVNTVPTTLLIDPQGKIVYSGPAVLARDSKDKSASAPVGALEAAFNKLSAGESSTYSSLPTSGCARNAAAGSYSRAGQDVHHP